MNAGVTLANIKSTISGKEVIVSFNNISMKSLDDTVLCMYSSTKAHDTKCLFSIEL